VDAVDEEGFEDGVMGVGADGVDRDRSDAGDLAHFARFGVAAEIRLVVDPEMDHRPRPGPT
jgi:hypothetical protein